MRFILRALVLGLAAFGAKALYDKVAGRSDELKETGSRVLDRAGAAAQDIRAMASDAAQNVADTARASADEIKQAASDNAQAVKKAAVDVKDTPS